MLRLIGCSIPSQTGWTATFNSRSSSSSAWMIGTVLEMALTPSQARIACQAFPSTRTRNQRTPRCAIVKRIPSGSVTIAASARWRRLAARAPLPVHSSSMTLWTMRSPASSIPASRSRRGSIKFRAMPLFMSIAPRPYIRSSTTSAAHGSCVQAATGSGLTTSMCPFKMSERPPPAPGRTPATFGRPGNGTPLSPAFGSRLTSSSRSQTSVSSPEARRCSAT